MQEYKIIFAGSMGAGKTSAIQALSDTKIVSTDVSNTDRATHGKLLTTVGIDYGQIFLDSDTKISLYGTPGQRRFEVVWRVITKGALGAIILIDASSEEAAEELPYYLKYFNNQGISNMVVGLTHTDLTKNLTIDDCFSILEQSDLMLTYPVFEIDAREREDIMLLIETLIATIEAGIY